MCGLVGVAGNLYKPHIDAFTQLLFVDTLRGQDSTGVAGCDLDGKAALLKSVGPAVDLIDRRGYDDVVRLTRRVIIGHNRFGTMGGKTKENAHPFAFDEVIGAHNGTVDFASKNRMIDGNKFGTDSEAIFNNIDIEGPDETIPKLDGAYALVWFNRRYAELNMIRNKERPLHYAYTKDRTVMFWGSEIGMLQWILRRNGIDYDNKIFELPIDKLYTWEVPKGSDKFAEPAAQEIEGFKKPPVLVQNFPRDGGHWVGGVWKPGPRPQTSHGGNSGSGTNATVSDGLSASGEAEKIAKELAAALGGDVPWYEDPELEELGYVQDDNDPWAFHSEESGSEWQARILNMKALGWTPEDKDASQIIPKPNSEAETALKAQAKEAAKSKKTVKVTKAKIPATGTPDQQVEDFRQAQQRAESNARNLARAGEDEPETTTYYGPIPAPGAPPIYDDTERKVWNPAIRKWQPLAFPGQEMEWSNVLMAWTPVPAARSNVVRLPKYKDPRNKQELTEEEFMTLTRRGCDWCSANLEFGDKVKFVCAPDNPSLVEAFCEACTTKNSECKQYLKIG